MTQPDLTGLRRQVLAQFDRWAAEIENGWITQIHITVRPFKKLDEAVVSSGLHDPEHLRKAGHLTNDA